MEMPAFDQIILSHMILLLVPGIIAAIAIIKAAVAVTIKVVMAVTIAYTIPTEAILTTDATKSAPDKDLIPRTHHNTDCLDNTVAGHNLHLDIAKDVDPTHIARSGLHHPGEDTAIVPI